MDVKRLAAAIRAARARSKAGKLVGSRRRWMADIGRLGGLARRGYRKAQVKN